MAWKYFTHDAPASELVSKDESSDCYYDHVPAFVEENGYLPVECRECYKGLIFWSASPANEAKFNRMLTSLPLSVHGKYDAGVVVFYFGHKDKMLSFLDVIESRMREFEVEGRIQWRVSGRYWQDQYPHLFASAKALKPVRVRKEVTMKEWLAKKKPNAKLRRRKEREF
jgi:hypothetical protein